MAQAKHSSNQAASTRELRHRVLTCLHKLSDRDTHSAAAAELESIARTLSQDSIPPFLSSIAATDSSDKSPVRKQCLRLISLLSEHHGNFLSPYLSKLVSAIIRRLRDPDSAVRAACVAASASISSHLTRPPSTSIMKPFVDALVTEQELNAQIGAASCLASAIDASPDPELMYLRKLLPRLEKLLKSEGFKAKPALLSLIGTVIAAGGASSPQAVRNLVPYLVEFVSSEDWAARKAAAESLVKLAATERDFLSELKASCLRTFEAKKFDKVKIVRETMNQMVEVWKEIPDLSDDDVSPPPELQSSSKGDNSDGRYPPGSKTTGAPQTRKTRIPTNRSLSPDSSSLNTARKRSSVDGSDKKGGPPMFEMLDRKKAADLKVETAAPRVPSTLVLGYNLDGIDEKGEESSINTKHQTKRALFVKNSDERAQRFGGSKARSRVVPFPTERSESTVVASNETADIFRNQKESEDLSLIRKQLVQIEKQQSNLLELLQRFIGSSQNGMLSLETRVHGLEVALDEISYDLAVSTARMSNNNDSVFTCCKLPVAGFFSSKIWKRMDVRHSASRFSSGGAPTMAATRGIANNDHVETYKAENRRLRFQGGGGFIVNPLAEIHSESRGISEIASSRISKNVNDTL